MMRLRYFSMLIAFVSICSCTEEFEMDLSEQEPILIVDALITDGIPPYFVKLTLSKNAFDKTFVSSDSDEFYWQNRFEPVLNAQIIVSDNQGVVDTLISDYVEAYRFSYNPVSSSWDSVFYIDNQRAEQGYYRTTKLQGKAGNSYKLTVKWNNNEYTSSCFMPECPKIDSVTYNYTLGEEGKVNFYVPHIWFKDNPETKDYYLFKTYGGVGVWSRSILSDEFIKDKISGLNVFQGESHDWWRNGYPMPDTNYRIEMYSVTKEVYNYYKSLIGQFRSDGGIYTPAPASAPSNISGHALGYFGAAATQFVESVMPRENK